MARVKLMSPSGHGLAVQQPILPARDEAQSDEDVEIRLSEDDASDIELDSTEIELERLVFGNSAKFSERLRKTHDVLVEQNHGEELDDGVTNLEALEDAQLFFTDTGGSSEFPTAPELAEIESEDETLPSQHVAAWEDSDDERMLISLASVPRLRKLRRTETEDIVNGKEYTKRLRRQYEALNGTPGWAVEAMEQPARKRRRLSSGFPPGHESGEEMNVDSENLSVAPLSKLLRDAEGLVRKSTQEGKKRSLRPQMIDIQRIKDIPGVQPSAITSLSFHPQLPLLLSSGPSSTLYLHHIVSSPPASAPNPLLTSVHIRGSQLSNTAFHPLDSRIFLSARRRYFHIWDLQTGMVQKISRIYGHQHEQRSMEYFKLSPDGKYMALLGSSKKGGGVVNILSTATLQWDSQVRIESRGGTSDFAWWSNSKGMCIVGKNGEVTEWHLADRRVIARWQDEGAVGATTLCLGGQHEFVKSLFGTDRWIAIGSSSGIVNIYDRRTWLAEPSKDAHAPPVPSNPKPARVLDHLTTPTSHLAFSPDGQLLAMASRWKRDAARLVHLPSCTVYRNWPTAATPLGRITGVAFADGEVVGGDVHSLLAVANEQGKIRLWEIR